MTNAPSEMQLAFAKAVLARTDELQGKLPITLPGIILEYSPFLRHNFLPDPDGGKCQSNFNRIDHDHPLDLNCILEQKINPDISKLNPTICHVAEVQIPLSHIGPMLRDTFQTERRGIGGSDSFDATVINLMNEAGRTYGYLVTQKTPDEINELIGYKIGEQRQYLEEKAARELKRTLALT